MLFRSGTILVNKTMQRANKDALEKLDPNQVYHTFPDRREGSKSSLILKKPKTKKSDRILYMTKPLKEELLAWLEKLKQDEQNAPEKYSNCGQLFRLPDGLPIAPELLTKWYRQWRSVHPEFEQLGGSAVSLQSPPWTLSPLLPKSCCLTSLSLPPHLLSGFLYYLTLT